MSKKKVKYILGIDVGIASTGYGLLELNEKDEPFRIIDSGVRIFEPGENIYTGETGAAARRASRGSRRLLRRRRFRLDLIRSELNKAGLLGEVDKTSTEDLVKFGKYSDKLQAYSSNLIDEYYKKENTNPYKLKVKGLNEKLNNTELLIIMTHYSKNRGYSSNRDEEAGDSEAGKVKAAIRENEKIMKEQNYKIPSEMFLKDTRFKNKIRNTTNDYKMVVTRESYKDELTLILEKQVELNVINNELKDKLIELWGNQRHYSKGPGGNSPYGGNLIEKMVGKCTFLKDQPRSPKAAPTAELFVAYSKLNNLRYKKNNNTRNYEALTLEETKKIIEVSRKQDKVTYNKISQVLGLTAPIYKGLELPRRQYGKIVGEFKVKVLGMPKDDMTKLDISSLSAEEKTTLDEMIEKEKNKKVLIEMNFYSEFRKSISKLLGTEKWEEFKNRYDIFDKVAVILTNLKTEEDVIKALAENKIPEELNDLILTELPNPKAHNNLSLKFMYDLIPLLEEGYQYHEAVEKLGFNHSDQFEGSEKHNLLLPINFDHSITNKRVNRSLAEVRKVINSVIKKSGLPHQINIETTRELARDAKERSQIQKRQDENRIKNIESKINLAKELPSIFSRPEYVKSFDLLKYKLWNEQNHRCAYSNKVITLDDLFSYNIVQVDHILPYSRTFNDNYLNKTLVLANENQDKGNRTPYEWIGNTEKWNQFESFINMLFIPQKKKDNYLLRNLTSEIASEFKEQNLNDTKYISKHLASVIKNFLNVDNVKTVSGSITGKVRAIWGLNGLTHSLESKTYYKEVDEFGYPLLGVKNRDNHLHHATDALVIASITPTLIKRITDYEKYKRYFINKTRNDINKYTDGENISDYNDETGEVNGTISLKDYVEKEMKEGYLKQRPGKETMQLYFPKPYDNFPEELKLRVYERDTNVLIKELNQLESYNDVDMNQITPIIPSFAKIKPVGRLHKDTVYGYKKIGEKILRTQRISVNKDNFNIKQLDSILYKEIGSRVVYESVKEWLGDHENGSVAFKENGGYPRNKLTNNEIKKITVGTEYKGNGHIINGKIVESESIHQIEVYKDEENRLHFIGLSYMEYLQIYKGKKDIEVTAWYGQTKNREAFKYSELNKKYKQYIIISKNDLLEITKTDGSMGITYSIGFSSGLFEVGSILGDGLDLIGANKLFAKERQQFRLTVSTIKSIKKLKLTTLGKID